MKVGKGPKRSGRPSETFVQRKAEEARKLAEQQRLAARTVPAEGPLLIFMDDVRTAPKGWVLVTDGDALSALLNAEGHRVERLSLDWHLGSGVPDGDEVVKALAERFADNPGALPELEAIHFHSDKHEAAVNMCRTAFKALPEGRKYDIMMDVGKPA